MWGSIFKGLGKEAGGAAVGAFKGSLGVLKALPRATGAALKFGFSQEGRHIASPLLRGGAEYFGYSMAADMLEDYSQGNFEHQGSKNVASVASFLLRAKGIHSAGMGIVGATGRASYSVADRITGTGKVANFARNRFDWIGDHLRPAGRSGAHKYTAGSTYDFLKGLSPERLLFKGAKMGLSGLGEVAAFPVNAVKGTYEYGKLFSTARRAGKAAHAVGGFRAAEHARWNTMLQGLSAMEHPIAPAMAIGVGLGAASGYMNKYSPKVPGVSGPDSWANMRSNLAPYMTNPASWEENRFTQPPFEGPWNNPTGGSEGHVDPSNFGSGITMGRSAIRSQTVMDGQLAVANKMVTRRRV